MWSIDFDEFAHILSAFLLVFPEDAQGRAKRAALLALAF